MSLNWREIDLVLGELDLIGAQVQKVVQPSYDTLVPTSPARRRSCCFA